MIESNEHPAKYVRWLALGNFLENYDFALYIHFASILSFLFFPPYFNPDQAVTFSFSITLLYSLLATVVWGNISDGRGRKIPLVWSCIIAAVAMVLIPIQASIFERTIFSAFLFCFLRGCVDFALTGEYLSTNIYITESYSQKKASFYSALVDGVCNLGVIAGLITSIVCLKYFKEGWKYPFFIGAAVAVVAAKVRSDVSESIEFQKLTLNQDELRVSFAKIWETHKSSLQKITCIEMLFGFGFFFIYLYCSKFLMNAGYTPEQILLNNALIAGVQGLASVFYGVLSLKVYALLITKIRAVILILWAVSLIFTFRTFVQDPQMIFVIQAVSVFLALDHIPAIPVFLKSFPVQARSRSFSRAFFIGKNLMYILTSIFIYMIEEQWGYEAVIVSWLVIIGLFTWGVFTYQAEDKIPVALKIKYTY